MILNDFLKIPKDMTKIKFEVKNILKSIDLSNCFLQIPNCKHAERNLILARHYSGTTGSFCTAVLLAGRVVQTNLRHQHTSRLKQVITNS